MTGQHKKSKIFKNYFFLLPFLYLSKTKCVFNVHEAFFQNGDWRPVSGVAELGCCHCPYTCTCYFKVSNGCHKFKYLFIFKYVYQTSKADGGITLIKNTPKILIVDPYQQFKLGLTPALGCACLLFACVLACS